MDNVIVIHEIDFDDNSHSVIGIADSIVVAEKMIKDYYGEFNVISYIDVRDSSIEYEKILNVKSIRDDYNVKVWLQWFELNRL